MLIILNLFFGKLIFESTRLWLGVEAILILLFIIKIHAFIRRISKQLRSEGGGLASGRQSQRQADGGSVSRHDRGKVIDIKGEVVEEKQKLQ
ncbi:MAG: hypothetical protein L6308_00800 [Candidatus Omnitrophica bacterium]|nr:hypothetical protein [Candidatus Omnitrophota bacterium]